MFVAEGQNLCNRDTALWRCSLCRSRFASATLLPRLRFALFSNLLSLSVSVLQSAANFLCQIFKPLSQLRLKLNVKTRLPPSYFSFHVRHNLSFGSRAFRVSVPKVWNTLHLHSRQSQSLSTFRCHLKTHYFQLAYPAT